MPNAVRVTSSDGFSELFPLSWLLERNALIATTVGGEPINESFGGSNQLWIEGAAARLFVRDVVKVEFLDLDHEPDPPSFEADDMLFRNRPNAGVTPQEKDSGLVGDEPRRVGEPVDLKGWAYDYDRAVSAVEFSLDGGCTWTRMATPGAEAGKILWWDFSYTPEIRGPYELLVRAVNEDGKVGPEPARYCFQIG